MNTPVPAGHNASVSAVSRIAPTAVCCAGGRFAPQSRVGGGPPPPRGRVDEGDPHAAVAAGRRECASRGAATDDYNIHHVSIRSRLAPSPPLDRQPPPSGPG